MRLSSKIVLSSLIFMTLISFFSMILVYADPPMGDDPQQKYPFLYDANFENENSAYGSSYVFPPRGTTYDSGQWYCALSFDYSPSMYSKIDNNRLKLYSHQAGGDIAGIPVHWASAVSQQGRGPYGAIQFGSFKGSNDTEANSVDTPRILFPMNETFPNSGSQNGGEGTEIWLIIKARITKRNWVGRIEGSAPNTGVANLGFFCGFQYEFRDDNGTYYLSDYDCANPEGNFHKACHYDIFLSRMIWYYGVPDPDAVGKEFHSFIPTNPYDNDLRVQRVVGEMDVGIWYTFKLDFGYLIERAKTMTKEYYPYLINPNCTALILRDLQIFAESCSAEIEAEVQYCLLSENEFSLSTATVRSYAWKNDEWISIPTSMYFDDEFRFGSSILYLSSPKDEWHKLEPLKKIAVRHATYYHGYDFVKWEIKGTNYTDTTKWVLFDNDFNINIYYNYFYEYIPRSGHGGGGGGPWDYRRFCTYSPDTISDYGFATNTSTSYIDQYSSITIRKTLGNTNGTIAFDVWTSEQEIQLDTLNIEEFECDLGKIWEENGRYNYFNPWSHSVDDITLRANIQNVSQCDIIFHNVPQVNKVEKNHIEMEKGEFWEYKDGDLIIHLEFGDPDIQIDFQTPITMILDIIKIVVIPFAIVCSIVVMVKKYVL